MQDYNQAFAYVAALTQADPNSVIVDVRMIHDQKKDIPALPMRGTLAQLWQTIVNRNNEGYGAFINISDMDGNGSHTVNVRASRVAVIDLDNMSAQQNLERANQWQPAPTFGVNTSPGKFHCYWSVPYFLDHNYFTYRQRQLRQLFDGDKTIVDPARVLRLPGTYHTKGDPFLVTCFAMAGWGRIVPHEALSAALAAVNVIDGGSGQRHALGDPELAAPALKWLDHGLKLCDPNTLDRGEWIALTSAFKQAGWSLTDPQTLFDMWSQWCSRYAANDPGENLKQWNSIRDTELGWESFRRRVPSLTALTMFGEKPATMPADTSAEQSASGDAPVAPIAMPDPTPLDCSGEYLTHLEQQQWFKNCVYVINGERMLTDDGRFVGPTGFNAAYGGKKFIIDTNGKMVNEAWQAATRSTLWTVPKVDHIRFLPSRSYRETIYDDRGRTGVNIYKPLDIKRVAGDVSPFLNHIAALLPDPADQRLLIEFLAHNAKYPGFKIPWAPVIQSAEGAGKGVMKLAMTHAMGRPYVYFPNAKELTNSGSQFNAWMRNRLFILADEIKVDDRRDLIEVLKPMISEEVIEIQGKGFDQDLEDNFSNWLFFTNWRDAIPVSKNQRRFAIFYSALQTAQDLIDRGMNDFYFKSLYSWIKGEGNYPHGAAIIADYLLGYPIERGGVPMRAPDTSSTAAAVEASRGPIERVLIEAVDDGLPGFRGGWISSIAASKRIKDAGAVRGGSVSSATLTSAIEALGYTACGRAPRAYMIEDRESRPYLFYKGGLADMNYYAAWQGYAG